MLKNTLIIVLLIALIYLYYQQKKTHFLAGGSGPEDTIRELQTQLQQAQQLEKFNVQQITCLQEQITAYQKEGD